MFDLLVAIRLLVVLFVLFVVSGFGVRLFRFRLFYVWMGSLFVCCFDCWLWLLLDLWLFVVLLLCLSC